MIKTKRVVAAVLAVLTLFNLTACGGKAENTNKGLSDQTAAQTEFKGNDNSGSKTLIVSFSYFDNTDSDSINSKRYADSMSSASVTVIDGKRNGNNDVVADILKDKTGADVFQIITKQQYSPNYDDGIVEQARTDGQNKVKPELASHIANIDSYDTFIIVYPIWWYDMPMAMYTFFDEYDFSGKTIAPVVTSGGSGLMNTVNSIKNLEPKATVTDGLAIYQTDVADCESDVTQWLDKVGISR